MKHFMKTQMLVLGVTLLSSVPFLAYADNEGLSEQEFADICAENHADQSRSMYPPLKEHDEDYFNYEFHFKDVQLSADGKSYVNIPYINKSDRDLMVGQIIMDMADGYEVSYEYQISGRSSEPNDKIIVEGKTITPYYRSVEVDGTTGSDKQYRYFSNEPEEIPVIPDFPMNYDWKKHEEDTLSVSAIVTVRSLKDGKTYNFPARMSSVTNLHKDKPDCYSLGPTDVEAYTVKKGDSLYKIAAAYYGNGNEWIYISERNKKDIKNPDLIYPGLLIVIPNAESIVPPYIY